MFGRFDLARLHTALATERNMFVGYRGGAYSRAGTAFCGFSKQTGRNYPPRLIPFQFSINQGLALEFGNFYMRVVSDGGFVTESPFAITGISQADPGVISYETLSTAMSVTAAVGDVTASYARGDYVVPAGGTFSVAAQFQVLTTTLAALGLNGGGADYAVGDQITLGGNGGTVGLAPVLTVTAVSGGVITAFVISNGGSFTNNGGGSFTQSSTTGSGSGATFNAAVFGPLTLSVTNPGDYTAVPANPANQASSSGAGLGATYTIIWATPNALNNGDWVAIEGIASPGPTQLNDQTFVISALTAATFAISDVYGNPINTAALTAWTAGGLISRIYTLATPYSELDLDYLKVTQSADVMSLCLVNQESLAEYAPLDLNRAADDSWSLANVVPNPTVLPPSGAAALASTSGSWDYQYVVTAVNPNDGTESIASNIAEVDSAVDIAATAGLITITWDPSDTTGVNEYNIYKATPSYEASPPVGSLFGYAGSAYGTQFADPNIVADFSQVPPTHQNPFARGQVLAVTDIVSTGTVTSVVTAINTLTGSGAVLVPIIIASVLVGYIIEDPGENYQPTDTISIVVTGGGSATATLDIGPESGTYPGVPFYFQERRGYAYSLNNPDTYWMSQPGSFTNFDYRTPTIDSDAITGSPWAVEVNGIQFAVLTAGGLLVLTGDSVWLLVGAGSFATNVQPISPSSQVALPQPEIGCSATVPPIKIDYDVIYLSSKGTIYFDLPYQLYALSTPLEITVNSSHLFVGFEIYQHAWCREPNKVLWAVRNDGVLLSLTWLKPEQVAGWARHDTQGAFVSVCSVTEPPVDALYVAAQRNFGLYGNAYVIERMDNRIWNNIEACWCVDCGFSLEQPAPNATLTASSASGAGAVTGVKDLVGGVGYSAGTTASVVDDEGEGPGSGAVPTLTIVDGVITAVTFQAGQQGQNYVYPALVFNDPAGTAGGSGAEATCVLNNAMTFTASANVFSNGDVGSFIRAGGGKAKITGYTSPTEVDAEIIQPITEIVPNAALPGTAPALIFSAAAAQNLTRPGSTLINQQKFTVAFWFKATANATNQIVYQANDGTANNEFLIFFLTTTGQLEIQGKTASVNNLVKRSTAGYLDGNWHNCVVAIDTTQSNAAQEVRAYIDGAEITSWSLNTIPPQNTNLSNNFAQPYSIATTFTGELAQFYYVDGQQLIPAQFIRGSAAIPYAGSYSGVFDFFLPFSNNVSTTTLGLDASGEGNNWTLENMSVADVDLAGPPSVTAAPQQIPQTFAAGDWTMTAPVTSVQVPQLAGATVTGLYDGNVIPPTVVPANGTFDLPSQASQVTLGLGFTAQLQTVYLNASENPTDQGQRKKIAYLTARVEASKLLEAGSNQVDGSTLSPPQVEVTWDGMQGIPDKGIPAYNESVSPLWTADSRLPIVGGFATPGQVAMQQTNPLPLNVTALIPEYETGDLPEQKYTPPQGGRRTA
jgi:hypothetical protein